MTDTGNIASFIGHAVERTHISLYVLSGCGLLGAIVKWLDRVLEPMFHGFLLTLTWLVGVAAIYSFIAFLIGSILSIVLGSILFRAKDDPKRERFMAKAGTWVMIIAPIVGVIIAMLNRTGPSVHEELVSTILFCIIGVGTIAVTVLLLIGAVQSHRQSRPPII